MKSLPEICRELTVGDPIDEESFDLDCVYFTLKELIAGHDVKYDPENPVPSDDALADRVFEAAVEFFVRCGVFCKDTRRIVRFTRNQTLDAVADHLGECRFGEGQQARVMRPRKPDSHHRPWCHVGAGIVASSEEIASQTVRGYASIPTADSMSVPALNTLAGRRVAAGTPPEILAAIRSIRLARDA